MIFTGYLLNIPVLQGSILGSPPTKFNSAVMFLILGICAYLLNTQKDNEKIKLLVQILSLALILFAFITLVQYIFNIHLPLDRILFSATIDNPTPTRTRFLSSINFLLLGSALLFLSTRRSINFAQILTLIAIFIAYLGLMTYLSDLGSLQGPNIYSQMALFSTISHVFVCVSFLTMYPKKGMMKPLHQNSPGGYMGRILLPVLVVFISLMGLLVSWGERTDIYNDQFGEVLLITIILFFLFFIILWMAQRLNQIDIDRRKYRTRVTEMERFFQNTIEGIVEGIMVNDSRNHVVYLNKGMVQILGIDGSSIMNQDILNFFKEKIPEFAEYYLQAQRELKPVFIDFLEFFKGSQKVYLSGWITPQIINGEFNGAIVTAADVTVTKEAEKILESSLKEKELLLAEIHHRVKNNMQIISSLLRLQSAFVEDVNAADLLIQSQSRIKTMAMVHESLYQSENFSSIDMSHYITKLVRGLQSTYHMEDKIDYKVDVDQIKLEIDTAIPVGLLINELVTNSIKHAFPHGNEGVITVKFNKLDSKYALIVKDNGVGIAEDFNFENITSLGLELIRGLVDQLDGTLDLKRNNGTETVITFEEIIQPPRI